MMSLVLGQVTKSELKTVEKADTRKLIGYFQFIS